MAERRMFAKSVVQSDCFVDMPVSAQALYFHLGINADDEGFINNPKMIQRCIGANGDDLRLLASKGFIIPFDTGVVVITDWKRNNYLQKDRIKKSSCREALLVHVEAGRYVLGPAPEHEEIQETKKKTSASREKRLKEYAESELPHSFGYKIREAFDGANCPVCGCKMNLNDQNSMPTIQHNIPISMGGKHEIGNISVICRSCNTSLQNRTITGDLNNQEVVKIWESINNVSGLYTQDRLGKDRLVKDRKEKKEKPVRHKYGKYSNVLLSDEDMDKLKSEFQKDWMRRIENLSEYMASTGKSYKNHLATIRNWARREKPKQQSSYVLDVPYDVDNYTY